MKREENVLKYLKKYNLFLFLLAHWAWINKNLEDPFQSRTLKVLCITWNMAGKVGFLIFLNFFEKHLFK